MLLNSISFSCKFDRNAEAETYANADTANSAKDKRGDAFASPLFHAILGFLLPGFSVLFHVALNRKNHKIPAVNSMIAFWACSR